ncbi:MAG: Ig-like domain-containing protein [Propioniciclava sp.]
MAALSWVRSRPKSLASIIGVTVGALALTSMAIAYEGFPTTKVDLNDGGVWLTKTSSLLVGHFNRESTVIDGGLRAASQDFDVLQDAGTVLVVDSQSVTTTTVDPAQVALTDSATIPADADVALGHLTTAILNRASGELWVASAAGLGSLDIKVTEPTAELGEHADITVGRDGTVYALAAERGEVVTIPTDPEGLPLEPQTASVGTITTPEKATITAVGTTPVVLDAAAGEVRTPDGITTHVSIPDDAVLQQASAEADAVALATPTELIRVPLDGAEPVTIPSGATPGIAAAPVFLRGCTYAAWGGSARFVRDCLGDAQDLAEPIPGAEDLTQPTFRVNRDVIVLNDIRSGAAWLADESLQRVDNWSVLTPPEGETENEEESTEETVETSLPERKEQNTPPVAVDDEFGVRPGGTTMLSVLDNDNDTDGDVLVASLASDQPSIGTVQPILNGAALQIQVPEEGTGRARFEYAINDGRGGKDSAFVEATVYDWDTNTGPQPKRVTKLAVEIGGTVSYNILPDWRDPEGDDVYLRGVEAAPGDEVRYTTDGQITYRAVASMQGRKEIKVKVSDAQGAVADGTILLDVKPLGSTAPVTNADHVVARVGETVTVAPLTNDTSASSEPLRLARVQEVPGATIVTDTANKQFTFKAPKPGTYYVQYLVTAGPKPAEGLVRVDILDDRESELPPIAVRDVALLPTGSEALIGVLANDTDPAGGVLVVQSVTVPPGSNLAVSVLNHETLRIADQGAVDEQVRISYRISNGTQSATGDVIVIPIPAPEEILPPVANDDEAVVRAGDVVTIPVLDNDVHPGGDTLHVAPGLVEPLVDPEDGEAFVSQDTVRFRAGPEAKTVNLTYEAVDSHGQKAGGLVSIQILPVDAETNAAPRPHDLTARALAGSTINIQVPLDGLDADGDSVELLGIDTAPTQGQITKTGPNFLEYEAFTDASGVDSFTYRVRDRLGKEGTASIRVGVAPPDTANQAPYAVKDSVVVRPGRSVAVPVLVNDSDPEGDPIGLVPNGLEPASEADVTAEVSGDRVIIEVPDRKLQTALQYTIADTHGAEATAPVIVTVDQDVPLTSPIARDDRIQLEDIKDGLTVDLDILSNDEDPDGTTEGLDVVVEAGGELLDNRSVRITVGEERQLIRYTITDQDDLTASAFIFVPAIPELRPTLLSTTPVEVKSGETRELPLADHVSVAGGGSVQITEAAKVSALNANGDSLVKDATTLVYTSRDGYFGEDALTFEVTDGTDINDPAGRTALLTLPIQVLPPDNQPPTFLNGQMQVAPGEDPTTLDLAELTTDPDPADAGKHSYAIIGQPGDGISARVDGSTLLAEAGRTTPKGTAVTLGIRISDGTSEPIEGSVEVQVTGSTRPLPVAGPDTIAEADQGTMLPVDVLKNDANPFPDTPLKLLSATTESGLGTAEVVGDVVQITPADDFVGVLVVRYRIQDATEDPDREVDGRVTVTVQGVPDAPGKPTVTTVADQTVVLSWSPPSNNGAEITQYTVTSVTGPSYSKTCTSTTCTLDGLQNNQEYGFQVTAHNRVGEGSPSITSDLARPDTRPDTPVPPSLTFGDRSLNVAWTAPTSSGSPVESYTLEISPTPPSGIGQKTGVTGTSLVWEGLENGTSYTVRVQAHNRAPEPSSWSRASQPEVPAGPPGATSAPRVTSAPAVGSQAQMSVTWDAAPQNGDAIAQYELLVYRGGSQVQTATVTGSQTSQTVSVATNATDYTFAVRARNKAGWGEPSPRSAPQRAFGTPGAPAKVTAEPLNGAIKLTASTPPLNGAKESELRYQYRLNSGSWVNWNGTSTIKATNGTDYTVSVRANSVVGGQQSAPGPAGTSATVTPYGPPRPPTGSAKNLGTQVRVSWNARNSANGRAITRTEISYGQGWETVSSRSGSRTVGNDYDQTHSIQIRVTDAAGQQATSKKYSAKTDPRPKPKVWVTPGDAYGTRTDCINGCRKLVVNWKDLNIGRRKVYCATQNGGVFTDRNTGRTVGPYDVNFNGSGSKQLPCWHGRDGVNVWVDIVGWGGDVDTEKRIFPRP